MSRIHVSPQSPAAPRFLSRPDCEALLTRIRGFASPGQDYINLNVDSSWTGNIRWARNLASTSGDTRNTVVEILLNDREAMGRYTINQLDDVSLKAAVQYAEEFQSYQKAGYSDAVAPRFVQDVYAKPNIWSERTYALDAGARAAVTAKLLDRVDAAGMLSSGYIQVAGVGTAVMVTNGLSLYYPHTQAQYSVTVRDPKGTGSGWAGVDWHDWGKIDAEQLTNIALDKCLRSRDPVAIEPGRYTAILEPQAVCDFFAPLIARSDLIVDTAFNNAGGSPFFDGEDPKLGSQIFDERMTISSDPMDPELGYVPFNHYGEPYRAVHWVDGGVLSKVPKSRGTAIQEDRDYAVLDNPRSFRMSGGTTSVDEMIATTQRGVLVTRFSNVQLADKPSWLCTGYTRDGFWLIEKGKISKAVKNFRFTESPMFAFNNIDQLGIPQRVFHPDSPVVVPPAEVRDFSFTSLSDAV